MNGNIYGPVNEGQEQAALIKWTYFAASKWPELKLLYHIPNEGKRTKYSGAKLKAEGLKPGVPDLCLPVARGKFHGLYIEMKIGKNKTTAAQDDWIAKLKQQGYAVFICYGWESASTCIENYMKLGGFIK